MRDRDLQPVGRCGWIAAAVLAALAWGPVRHAGAQDALEYATVPEITEEFVGPQNLPGHRKGGGAQEELVESPPPELGGAADGRQWLGGEPWWGWSRATGDWGGVRTDLEALGLTFEASYTLDWSSVWEGGVANRASTRSLFDANLTADLDALFGLSGGSIFVDFYSIDGRGGSADAGDFQGFSNIEAGDNIDQVAEVWYEQRLFDGVVRVKLGKIEANSEFAYVDAAGEFINSSAGFSPTILPMPTYPDPAVGLAVFAHPTEQVYIGGGVFDGSATVDGVHTGGQGVEEFFSDERSDDYVFLAEGGLTWERVGSLGAGRLVAGVWHHTGDFVDFGGAPSGSTEGFYALFEQQLIASEDGVGDLSAFAQYGWADPGVSEANHHVGGGLAYTGICRARPDDSAGVYCSFVDFSGRAGFGEGSETTLESYYGFALTPAVCVKPDLQFIINPGGDPSIENALVATLRVTVAF